MIARGSGDESEARRYVAYWQAMMAHWNAEADSFRRVARARVEASPAVLADADRTRSDVQDALQLCDKLVDNLPPGHELMGELLQIATGLDALSESLAVSAEQMIPRIEERRDVAQLKYLVSIVRESGGLAASQR